MLWILERRASVLFANDQVITIDVLNEGYLGGAHGFRERTILTFDAKDGRRLNFSEFVSDESKPLLQRVAEAELRKVREVPASSSLAQQGFFVKEGEALKITENFGIVENGLLLHYNPYDIGPYALGPTDLVIPREVLKPLLRGEASRVSRLFDGAADRS
jgi:hypothetical protein